MSGRMYTEWLVVMAEGSWLRGRAYATAVQKAVFAWTLLCGKPRIIQCPKEYVPCCVRHALRAHAVANGILFTESNRLRGSPTDRVALLSLEPAYLMPCDVLRYAARHVRKSRRVRFRGFTSKKNATTLRVSVDYLISV